jgi:MFS family permease
LASVERAASSSSGMVSAPSSPVDVGFGKRPLGAMFRRLWWATGISASGDGLLAVAVPLLAVTLTRNPLIIAGLTGVNRGAAAIAALPGGLVADRWDRRRVMVACNLAAGVVLLLLVGTMTVGWAELAALYIVATVLAACDVTYTLAVQASLPDVIASERLGVANGRLIAVEGAGEQFIGPASGGILFSLAQRLPFFADGISFFVSAWLVARGLPRASHPADTAAASIVTGPVGAGNSVNAPAVPGADVDRPIGTSSNSPRPDAASPDTGNPGAGNPGAGNPGAGNPGAGNPGAGNPGAGNPGAGNPDGADPDAARPDRGSLGPATEPIDTPEGNGGFGPRPFRSDGQPRWVVDLREGLSTFNRYAALKLLAVVAAVTAFCQTMVFAILVLYGQQALHLSPTGYGLFLAFAAVIGVAGAQFAGHIQHRLGSGQLLLGGLTLAVISYIGLAFTHSVVLAVFVFGLQEIGTVAANVGSVTARQHIIPRHLYGRVGSVHRLAVLSASVAGALTGGLVASASSVQAVMLTAGALLFVTTVIFAPWLSRRLPAIAGHA